MGRAGEGRLFFDCGPPRNADTHEGSNATICIILSETGLETEAPPRRRHATADDEASLQRLVRERLGDRTG